MKKRGGEGKRRRKGKKPISKKTNSNHMHHSPCHVSLCCHLWAISWKCNLWSPNFLTKARRLDPGTRNQGGRSGCPSPISGHDLTYPPPSGNLVGNLESIYTLFPHSFTEGEAESQSRRQLGSSHRASPSVNRYVLGTDCMLGARPRTWRYPVSAFVDLVVG